MDELMERRKAMAAHVVANPQCFKVCCGCGSVLHADAGVCPFCNAYRFETCPNIVIERAQALAKKRPELELLMITPRSKG